MTKTRNKSKIVLYIASVLSFIAAAISIAAIVVFAFNITSIIDVVENVVNKLGYTFKGADVSFLCVEFGIVGLIDLFAGFRYISVANRKYNLRRLGTTLIWQTIIQMFFGSLAAGIVGCIGINMALRQMQKPISQEEQVAFMNDYKKKAMGEAITRLKELKAQGAISEEEYYETLNKILEG
jgi:uncharacterized membrane protein